MSKKVVQDIIKPNGRQYDHTPMNINTQPAIHMGEQRQRAERVIYKEPLQNKRSSLEEELSRVSHKGSGSGSQFWLWALVVGVSGTLLFFMLSLFSGTVVKVVPLEKKLDVAGTYAVSKEVKVDSIPFKTIVLSDEQSKKIPATLEQNVSIKASGKIVIYNAYGSSAQVLVKNTRFETPDGKIYRIDKSVTVPGTKVANGEVVPGSVEAVVYADIPGEEYNIGLSDFTIPGFKGDPRYSKFYARSKTEIGGGYSGVIKSADPEIISTTEKELQEGLKMRLIEESRLQVPADFVLYDEMMFFGFEDAEKDTNKKDDTVEVSQKGTLYGVIFERKELSNFLAQNLAPVHDGQDVSIDNIEELKVAVKDKDSFVPEGMDSFEILVSGVGDFVWGIDETKLKDDLKGINKSSALGVIATYPNIEKAEVVVRPFWKDVLPDNPDKITIERVKNTD